MTVRFGGFPQGKVVTVYVPGRPPGANDLIRMGHWKIGKVRAEWKQRTIDAVGPILDFPDWKPIERCSVAVEWRCRVRRRRDYDNLVSGIKPLLDGLVAAGVITDDSSDAIQVLGPLTIVVGAAEDQTVLTVTEIP